MIKLLAALLFFSVAYDALYMSISSSRCHLALGQNDTQQTALQLHNLGDQQGQLTSGEEVADGDLNSGIEQDEGSETYQILEI